MRSHPSEIPFMTGTPAPIKNLKPVHRLLRRAAGESAIAHLTRALLLLAVTIFTVLAVKSIARDDAATSKAADSSSHGGSSQTSK